MMEDLLHLLLANAVASAALALVAWGAGRRTRPEIAHALWVLALLKLVTPPIVPLPVLPTQTLRASVLLPQPAPPVADAPIHAEARPAPRTDSTPRPHAVLDPATAVVAGLALGAVVLGTVAARRTHRFHRLLRRASAAPDDLAARTAALAARIGLRRPPPLRLLPARVPPMLWPGLRGPVLLLPADLVPRLRADECSAVILHELAHVRRGDHRLRALELLGTTLFWWSPATWWVRRSMRRAEERCCDEWVLRLMPRSAAAYARGLVESLAFVSGASRPLPLAASGMTPVGDIETRLKEILMARPTPRLATPPRLAFAAAAVCLLAVFPTRAEPPDPEPPDPPSRPIVAPAVPAPVTPPIAPAVAVPVAPAARPAPPPPAEAPRAPAPRRPVQAERLEHEQLELQARQADLQRRQLELAFRAFELERQSLQQQLHAEAEQLRARGDAESAARFEERARALARRLELKRRRLERRERELAEQAEILEAEQHARTAEAEAMREAMAGQEMAIEAEIGRAGEELERQLESQLEALRQLGTRTGSSGETFTKQLRRLEAALRALRDDPDRP